MSKMQASGWESIQTWLHPTTAGVCWEICNIQRISGDGQIIAGRVQNCEEEDGETEGEEGRVELSQSLIQESNVTSLVWMIPCLFNTYVCGVAAHTTFADNSEYCKQQE